MLSAHPSSYLPHHTHTQSSCWPYSYFHVKQTSFSVLLQKCQDLCSKYFPIAISSVQWLSQFWLSETLLCAAHQASLSINNSQSLLKIQAIKTVMPSNHLILWRPLLLWPSIFPCIRVFSNEPVFASDGQSIVASALVLPMNIQTDFL